MNRRGDQHQPGPPKVRALAQRLERLTAQLKCKAQPGHIDYISKADAANVSTWCAGELENLAGTFSELLEQARQAERALGIAHGMLARTRRHDPDEIEAMQHHHRNLSRALMRMDGTR